MPVILHTMTGIQCYFDSHAFIRNIQDTIGFPALLCKHALLVYGIHIRQVDRCCCAQRSEENNLLHHPRRITPLLQYIRYPLAGMSVTIWIAGMGHLLILFLVLKKNLEHPVDGLFVCTNELESPCINTFRSFSGVARDKSN